MARYTADNIVLLLGEKEARTPIAWQALEEVPSLLQGRSWVPIGGTYSTEAVPGTLDGHLKGYLARATGGWVAVVLETAGVIEIDRSQPARVRLATGSVSFGPARGSQRASRAASRRDPGTRTSDLRAPSRASLATVRWRPAWGWERRAAPARPGQRVCRPRSERLRRRQRWYFSPWKASSCGVKSR